MGQSRLNMNLEKRIMKFSLFGSAIFVIAECILSFIINSNTIFVDFVFGCFDLLMMYPFLALIPYLYKPVSEKHPYGYAQLESLFVLIKFLILFGIIINLVIENIKVILNGGNVIDAGLVLILEAVLGLYELTIYVVLRIMSRGHVSSIIASELYMWKIDLISIVSIMFSFAVQLVLGRTRAAFLVPYLDPAVAVILSIVFIREPIHHIFRSVRELILFAPKDDVMHMIREVVEKDISRYNYEVSFLDVIQTGRKVWIDIYVRHKDEMIDIKEFRKISLDVSRDLKDEFDQLYVELIPELAEEA